MLVNEEFIKKVVRRVLKEVALCRDEKGHFSKCEKGKTYSLSKAGAERAGVNPKYVKRGVVTSTKTKDGVPRTRARFGTNGSKEQSAGRMTIDGDPISPKYYVSKYKKKYSDKNEAAEEEDFLIVDTDDMKGLLLDELQNVLSSFERPEELEETSNQRCPTGCYKWNDVLRSLNALVKASKGEIGEK